MSRHKQRTRYLGTEYGGKGHVLTVRDLRTALTLNYVSFMRAKSYAHRPRNKTFTQE